MSAPRCFHLREADAERVGGGEASGYGLCAFPDDEPGRFLDAPAWLLRQVGAGQLVHVATECAQCPAFRGDGQ
jgi:hypothetical protein